MSERLPPRLLVGQVGKPHGIMGEVYVVSISDDPHRFDPGARLTRGDESAVEIESMRHHGSGLLVKFVGVSSRDEADALRGPLYVASEEVRTLDENEYWPDDLIGCRVVEGETSWGTVTEVRPGSAHDLLVVDTERGERMVPLVKDIVVEVDLERRSIAISPPAGLLE